MAEQVLNVLDETGTKTLVGFIRKEIDNAKNSVILEFGSHLNFPVIGKEKTIYIDKEHNMIYRWDEASLKYYKTGDDLSKISVIDANF